MFIPFGKHVERDPDKAYILATGIQECLVCKNIILEAFKYGPNFGDLCELMVDEMQEMCRAQQRVLQSCRSLRITVLSNLGGTQQLRSPSELKMPYVLVRSFVGMFMFVVLWHRPGNFKSKYTHENKIRVNEKPEFQQRPTDYVVFFPSHTGSKPNALNLRETEAGMDVVLEEEVEDS